MKNKGMAEKIQQMKAAEGMFNKYLTIIYTSGMEENLFVNAWKQQGDYLSYQTDERFRCINMRAVEYYDVTEPKDETNIEKEIN
jgi:hypothetical protein